MSGTDHSGDARYAQVLRWPNREELARRLPPLLLGISLMGFAIALSVRAELGLAPWDVFHQGLADVFDLELGTVAVLVGLVVLIAWIPLHQQLGVGTIINTLTVGLVANVGLAVVPEQQLLTVRIPMLVCALLGFGVGSGLYIGAGLGPGPRDGLMTAIAARGYRIWVVRTVLECSVLVVGVALGGKVGIGTVLLAFGLGPLTHAALRRFHLPVDDGAPEVLGE